MSARRARPLSLLCESVHQYLLLVAKAGHVSSGAKPLPGFFPPHVDNELSEATTVGKQPGGRMQRAIGQNRAALR